MGVRFEMTQTGQLSENRIDPDPLTIVTLSLTAASFVLQFIQTCAAVTPVALPHGLDQAAVGSLMQLEKEARNLGQAIDRLNRLIEYGTTFLENEYYGAPFRVSQTNLLLDTNTHAQLTGELAMAYTTAGSLSNWVNFVIRQHPSTAYKLGTHMQGGLSGMAGRLNEALAHGYANRMLLIEGRLALDELLRAISNEIGLRN